MIRLSLTLVAARGNVRGLAAALQSLMLQAEARTGCLGCRISTNLSDPNTLHYVEDWATEQDLRADLHSERFRRLVQVMEQAAERPRFDVEIVTQSSGLEYVERTFGGDHC